jgi:hypothetical protein
MEQLLMDFDMDWEIYPMMMTMMKMKMMKRILRMKIYKNVFVYHAHYIIQHGMDLPNSNKEQ